MVVSMQRFNVSDCQKMVSETKYYLLAIIRTSSVFVDLNVGIKNYNFKFPLILDEFNIMIVMQKLKFKQEFTSAFNVECLHSSLKAKLLMHNCARAKNAKTCLCSILSNLKAQSSGK